MVGLLLLRIKRQGLLHLFLAIAPFPVIVPSLLPFILAWKRIDCILASLLLWRCVLAYENTTEREPLLLVRHTLDPTLSHGVPQKSRNDRRILFNQPRLQPRRQQAPLAA